ncbi:MAG: threonine/serine dehydratase [Hyphomicrobiaceae bacterium]
MTNLQPDKDDLRDAEATLKGVVRTTPLLGSAALDRELGARVLIKAESLQITGSFKMRGAFYRLSRLEAEKRRSGVIAFSSGNFAQGLAAAGTQLGIPVTIVMPEDAPAAKIKATRDWGAEVVLSRHGPRNREAVASARAREIAQATGAVLLHPFDDPLIVAGQSTAALEMLRQAHDDGTDPDAVLVPVGGGGLIAGAALACQSFDPAPEVYAIEPAGYDDFGRSLTAGERLANERSLPTLCDALQAQMPGEVPFGVAKGRVVKGVAVGDAAVRRAMALAFRHLKIVLEPSGAVALAALLDGTMPKLAGKTVAVLASGGNVALDDFARLTAEHGIN